MNALEYNSLRRELVEWVKSLKDTSLLNLLATIRNSNQETDKDWWDELTEADQSEILAGLDDIQKGRVVSSEEFWKRLKDE
jgi:hypothetical protein